AALSAAAAAITPLVQGLAALLDAAGPIGPAIVAMVVAFRGLNGARAALTAVATSLATVSKTASGTSVEIGALGQRLQKMGASESAVTRLSRAFAQLGTAIPIAAAALVGIIALYEQAASKADEAARAVANGSMSMRQAIEQEVGQLENRNAAYRAANIEDQEVASVSPDM